MSIFFTKVADRKPEKSLHLRCFPVSLPNITELFFEKHVCVVAPLTKHHSFSPVGTRHKLNVQKTCRRRLGCFLKCKLFRINRGRMWYLFFFLTYILTSYIENIHKEKLWIHKIHTRKDLEPTKYPREKKFEPTKYTRENISDPRDSQWPETHGI